LDVQAQLAELNLELRSAKKLLSEHALALPTPFACPPVHVDPTHFRQILSNLLENATRFAQQGSGHVAVQLHKRDYGLLIAVLDDGPPVATSVKAHLFEPFQTDSPQGTGLGLFLAREYAKANGGELRLLEAGDVPKPSATLLPAPYAKAFILSLPWAKEGALGSDAAML
jgi:signal transduction histidine kinase